MIEHPPGGDESTAVAKLDLRREMRERRAQLVAEGSVGRRSAIVVERLLGLDAVRSARRIVAYRSLPTEVDTTALLERCQADGVEVVVPDQRSTATFPVAARWADVIVVPGLAMTRDGRRLGQGGGWYDRFLPDRRADCPAIGLAFDVQIVDGVPVEAHDVRLDCVVSEQAAWWSS